MKTVIELLYYEDNNYQFYNDVVSHGIVYSKNSEFLEIYYVDCKIEKTTRVNLERVRDYTVYNV